MIIHDEQGDTLAGAIDGVNCLYETSLDFDPESVVVYVNGRRKILREDFEDGADIVVPRQVRMRSPLLAGDTLTVAYSLAGSGTIGGQPGGVPPLPSVCQDAPPAFVADGPMAPMSDAELSPPPFCAC